MKHDLEKTIKHPRVGSVEYEYYYSSFTDVVTIVGKWKILDDVERVHIPCENLDELIEFLQDARMMFNLGQYKEGVSYE